MAGTTANKHLRYPTGGDAPSFAVDMKNLADDVDAQLQTLNPSSVYDTGWQSLVVSAANYSASSIFVPKYRRRGSTVFLIGAVTRSIDTPVNSAWNGAAIFNALPSDCRLSYGVGAGATYVTWSGPGGTGAIMQISIYPDGTVQARNMGTAALPAGSNIGLDFSYAVG